MAIGIRVWIGVKDGSRSSDDDHCHLETVAHNEETCQKMIDLLNLHATHFPVPRMLILKGRICDR